MRRRLGGFESAEAWTGASFPYNAVVVLQLNGQPRIEAVEAALAAVQRRHPLLRARLDRTVRPGTVVIPWQTSGGDSAAVLVTDPQRPVAVRVRRSR